MPSIPFSERLAELFKPSTTAPLGAAMLHQKSSATAGMVSLHMPGQAVWTPRDYAGLSRNGYGRNVIAFRCIRMLAEAAASVPLTLKEAGHNLSGHPVLSLLRKPNPDQSQGDFIQDIIGYLQTAGNAYIEAVRIGGEIRELHVLRPDRMKVRLDAQGWPSAYEYSVGGRKLIFSEADDGFMPILHIKTFHPLNDHYGMSPLEVAADGVDIHNAANAWNKSLLDNAARPSGALVYKGADGGGGLTGEQFDRLKSELQETYQGQRNAGRPMVLDGGLDWKQMSLSPADMDFINTKNTAARDIALAFGVPPMLLGIPGDNTYANYREANLAFWRQTVLPLLSRVTAGLANWLCMDDCLSLHPDTNNIEALKAEKHDRLQQVINADFLTDAEKRTALGFPATPDQGAE